MKIARFIVSAAVLAILAACGGGGGGDGGNDGGGDPPDPTLPPTSTPTPTPVVSSVDAPFVVGSESRYMVYSPSLTQLGGSASGAVPDEAGVIRTFGTTQFSADTQVVDLMGDASYVVAGFTNGQVTTSTNPGGIAISDTSYWYTAAFNRFAAMPADAAPTCAGRFTVPTSGSVKGTIQGTASLAVVSGTATATIQLDMTPAGGAAATTIGQTATFDASSLSSVKVSGGFLSSGSGMATALGEGVNGGFVLVSPWKIVLANNTLYSGIAVFTCN